MNRLNIPIAVPFMFSVILGCAHQPETLYSPQHKNIEEFSAQMSKDLQAGTEKLVGHSLYSKSELDAKTGLFHFTTEIVPRAGFSAIYDSYDNYCVGRGGVFDGGRYGKNLCINADTEEPIFFVSFRKQEDFNYAGGENYLITADEAIDGSNSYKLLDIAKREGFKTTREREMDAQWEEIGKKTAKINLLDFQKNATVGTRVFCGVIVDTRGTLVEVQSLSRAKAWVSRESLKQPKEFSDRPSEMGFCEGYLTQMSK